MKKPFISFLLLLFPLALFAQVNVSRIGQVIYDPIVTEQKEILLSPLSLGFTMYRVHMILALWWEFKSFSNYEYARLIVSLQDTLTYNILDLLEFELDKWVIIDSYLSTLDKYLMESDIALWNIKEEMSALNYSMQHCLSQKELYDKQYLDSIQYPYQQALLDDSIENSKKYWQCASDSRIEYNAKELLADKISKYRSVINLKYEYLSANRDNIVDHYDLIRTDILERLIIIKNMLEKYDL